MSKTKTTEATPATWEEACAQSLRRVLSNQEGFAPLRTDQGCEDHLRLCVRIAVGRANGDSQFVDLGVEGPYEAPLAGLANTAWRWLELEGTQPTHEWVVQKLAEKQAAYGPGNILAFGDFGIVVRCSDKVERIANMRAKGRRSDDESLFDSLFDLVGYAVIEDMLRHGTFELPLERDLAAAVDEAVRDEEERAWLWRARILAAIPPYLHEVAPVDQIVASALASGLDPAETPIQFRVV